MTNSTETLAPVVEISNIDPVVEISTLATRLENLAHLNLEDKLSLKILGEKINELIVFVNAINDRNEIKIASVSRNRGPKSEKVMDENDARRAMLGDLKDVSHKSAAEILGLSYGQIYSARKGFTFKTIYKEMMDAIKATQATL